MNTPKAQGSPSAHHLFLRAVIHSDESYDFSFLHTLTQNRRFQLAGGQGAGAIGQRFHCAVLRHIHNVRAGEFVPSRHLPPINVGSNLDLLGKRVTPDFVPVLRTWNGEVDNRLEAPHKRVVDIAALVRRQNHQPPVVLDPLQQIGHS